MESVSIRVLEPSELTAAFSLIEESFLEFVAPSYSQEGIDTFRSEFLDNPAFRAALQKGKLWMTGAFVNGGLAGVIAAGESGTVSCLFVRGRFHRHGVGRALFGSVVSRLKEAGLQAIRLNASPYGLPFYRALGFEATGTERVWKGIRYTPMMKQIGEKPAD